MQTALPESTPKSTAPVDLEIKDAQLIFNHVWKQLEEDYGRENLRFPKELILLGGAPGAGKGTNTDFIRELRGITAEPIVVSALLDSPEAQKLKSQGGMVGDRASAGSGRAPTYRTGRPITIRSGRSLSASPPWASR